MANLLSTTVNGNLITSGGYTTSNYTRILYPSGGSYVTTTSVITGAIRIKLPTQGSAMMMTCTVKVYEYSTNKSFTITFGGHRDSANWYNEFCYLDGDSARGNLTVRFGVDEGKDCVWIGDTSTQWSYPQVFITDVQLGYTGYNQTWASGWSVGFVTSFGSVGRTQTAYAKITNANIGSQSVSYATTAGSAPNGSNLNTYYDVYAGVGNGLRFWGGSDSYKISMGVGTLYQYGTVSDYSIKMQMNDDSTGRGFTWGRISYAPIASLNSTSGDFQVAGSVRSTQFRLTNSTNNAYITGANDWGVTIVNDNGWIQLGPASDSWAHIYSNRTFYFNQDLYVNNTRVVLNSGTWGINITGSANSASTAGSAGVSTYARRIAGAERTGFNVGGNASTFYPIAIFTGAGATENQYSEFIIERGGYEDPGYSGIGFSTFNARFSYKPSGWGYQATYFHLEQLTQTATMLGDYVDQYQSSQAIIWLRGATRYNIYSVYGGITLIFANEDGGSYSMAYGTYDPIDSPREKATTNKYYEGSVRYSGTIYTGSESVIHSGNISSQSVSVARQLLSPNNATVVAADSAMPSTGHSFIHTLALGPGGNDGHILGMSWASTTSVYGAQIFLDTDPNDIMAIRSRSSTGVWTSWKTIIHSGTIGSQSVNYANSSGSAGYADEAKWISYPDGPRDLSDRSPSWNNRSVAWDFVGAASANGTGNYGGVMTFVPWDGTSGSTGDSSYQLAFANTTGVNASGQPKLSIRNGINSSWNAWYTLIHSGNIGSQNVALLQGYSAYSLIENSRGTHSGSDFPNGTLVTTDINASEWAGASFVMEVSGKSYSSQSPFKLIMQGYLYADTIINVSAMSYGSYFPAPVKVMNLNGNLAFWWPRGSYWNSFEVHVRDAGGSGWNRVTGIDNSVDPEEATKKVSCTPIQVLHTNTSTINTTDVNATNFRVSNAVYFGGGNNYLNWTNNRIYSNVGIEAPIFYDANDTGFYLDPNGSSRISYVYTDQVYTYGWFRNYGTQGMYNQDYGTHFYSYGGSNWGITGNGSNIYLAFRSNHESTIRGYVHANTDNNIGFLSEDGNWVLRTWNRGVEAYGSMRAPIFYDSNDTGYYVDPNSSSQLSSVYANNWFRPQGNSGLYFQSYGYGIWSAESGGSSYGNVSTYTAGRNSWPGYAIGDDACFMARDIRRGIYLPPQSGWLIRWESADNMAHVDFELQWGSDIRHKSNIKRLTNSLDKVKQLKGVSYNYKGNERTSIGFIAQEVEPILPEVVSTDGDGFKSVGYANIVALLSEAIKEQQAMIEELRAEIEVLKSK